MFSLVKPKHQTSVIYSDGYSPLHKLNSKSGSSYDNVNRTLDKQDAFRATSF